jgi:hypothetical protein
MNHIAKLTQERNEYREQLAVTREHLDILLAYLGSDKFRTDDYVHVRTDLWPKIMHLRSLVTL